MSVEEAILELLKVHNRVILPGFGAFLVAKDDPQEKPYILFNSFLSFNDGLLVGYLAEHNNVDTIEATDLVAAYVTLLKKTLSEDKDYKFNFLGSFDFEEGGAMRFKHNPNIGNAATKQNPHAKASLTPKKEEPKKVEVKKEEPKKEEAKKEAQLKDPVQKPIGAVPESKMESKGVITTTSNDDLLDFDTSTPPTVIIDQDNTTSSTIGVGLSEPKFELVEEKYARFTNHSMESKPEQTTLLEPEQDTRKKKNYIVIATVAILLLLTLGYIFMRYLPNQQEEEAQKKAMEKEALHQIILKHQSDSIALVKTRELAIADSIQLADETKLPSLSSGYHIIMGAFTEEANADKLIAKIKGADFPLVQKIKYKNRYLVSVEVCSDLPVANKRLEVIVQTLKMEGWIYKSK